MLPLPPAIEAVIRAFDGKQEPFDPMDVQSQLTAERKQNSAAWPADHDLAAWCEIVAFSVMAGPSGGPTPWGTYFGPMMSGTKSDGTPFYRPNIADADATFVSHWIERAQTLRHPCLRARYADIAWDLGPKIAGAPKRDVSLARLAIDTYIEASSLGSGEPIHERFQWSKRAVVLACQIKDADRTNLARAALIRLHDNYKNDRNGVWWARAYDFLSSLPRANLTEPERLHLVADLESALKASSDPTGESLDPHHTADAGERLVKHYTRAGSQPDIRRVWEVVARSHEHHASLGDAMLASHFLELSIKAFKAAGLHKEAERARVRMEAKIQESVGQMQEISTTFQISPEQKEAFLNKVVVESDAQSLANIAVEFLLSPDELQDDVKRASEQAPITSLISHSIIAANRVVGRVGAVNDDPLGHLIRQGVTSLDYNARWLHWALLRAVEKHGFTPDHFAIWANQRGLFEDDIEFLREGLRAWQEKDYAKAVHLLIPQVERGLRAAVGKLGRPVTKAHRVEGTSVAVNMADILYDQDLVAALGPLGTRLRIHFLSLYCDPRGMNLRNDFAHGLLSANEAALGSTALIVHSLLVLGIWQPPETAA